MGKTKYLDWICHECGNTFDEPEKQYIVSNGERDYITVCPVCGSIQIKNIKKEEE